MIAWPDELFDEVQDSLDREDPTPLHKQLSTRLEAAIRSGRIPAGSKMLNEIALALRLGVSRPTVRRALQGLVEQGLLVRRRGAGTQVVSGMVNRPLELTSLAEDLRRTSHESGTEVLLHAVERTSDEIASRLGLPRDGEVLHLRRLRFADGAPVAVLENYLPVGFAALTAARLAETGLYELLREEGVSIRIANQSIGARRATGLEAGLLGISRGGPLLTMERIAFDDSGTAVEYGTHVYRPDLYRFETTLVAK